MTDKSAYGVLRSLVRDLVSRTPTIEILNSRTVMSMRQHRTAKEAALAIQKMIIPFSFWPTVLENKKMFTVRASIMRMEELPDRGWMMYLDQFKAELSKDRRHCAAMRDMTDTGYTGHALARLFQRANVIKTEDVLASLESGLTNVFLWELFIAHDSTLLPLQVVWPIRGGCFLGEIEYLDVDRSRAYRITLKTFVPGGNARIDRAASGVLMCYQLFKAGKTSAELTAAIVETMHETVVQNPWLLTPYKEEI